MSKKNDEVQVLASKNAPKEMEKKSIDDYDIVSTPEFKLKDHPSARQIQMIDLRYMFGGIPDLIAIQKVPGKNNKIMVKAFVPKKAKKLSEKELLKRAGLKKEDLSKEERKSLKEITKGVSDK